MTQREFFSAVMNNGNNAPEIIEYAAEQIEKLDTQAAKRNSKNAALKNAIMDCFSAGGALTSKEVAEILEITPQKANAVLKQLVDEGELAVSQIAYKKRLINSYSSVKD